MVVEMYTRRHLESNCRQTLKEGKVLVLIGARQTGKSTLAGELLRGLPGTECLALNLDNPFLRDRLVQTEHGLTEVIEDKAQRPLSAIQSFTLVIDEAQKAPALFERLKALHDAEGSKLRLVLTGSSALEIHDPVAETLAGRARIFHLPSFTLSEGFAHAQGEDPTTDQLPKIVSRLLRGRLTTEDFKDLVERGRFQATERRRFTDQHLRWPLFPEPSNSTEPEGWIRDYLTTYFEKDIQSLASLGNVALFRACLRQVAARVGTTMKWETAAQEVGTTSVTLRKYVGLMEQTLNLVRLAPFTVNPVKRVIKAPKLYFLDNGLMWGLRGFEDRRLLEASGMLGAYAEAAVINEIARWCALEPTNPELRFWAKTAASEVDLVISNRGYHIPFEIKLSRTFNRRWLHGLDAFDRDHRHLGLEVPYRILVHSGEPEIVDERTFVLPFWLFA
jgi:predicted AAA+ superfamily ATPase